MSEFEKEVKELQKSGKLKSFISHTSNKVSHKQNVPKIAKKWSLAQNDYALLKSGFFWENIRKNEGK